MDGWEEVEKRRTNDRNRMIGKKIHWAGQLSVDCVDCVPKHIKYIWRLPLVLLCMAVVKLLSRIMVGEIDLQKVCW